MNFDDITKATPLPGRPFQLPQDRNDDVRGALTCPTCKRNGTIHAERDISRPLAMHLYCRAGTDDGCGLLGMFEPDPDLWVGQDPVVCVRLLQAWLNGLDAPSHPEDAVSQLGSLERKDREIESLRSHLAQHAKKVHSLYHHEAYDESWQKCPYPTCMNARVVLGIMTVPE